MRLGMGCINVFFFKESSQTKWEGILDISLSVFGDVHAVHGVFIPILKNITSKNHAAIEFAGGICPTSSVKIT